MPSSQKLLYTPARIEHNTIQPCPLKRVHMGDVTHKHMSCYSHRVWDWAEGIPLRLSPCISDQIETELWIHLNAKHALLTLSKRPLALKYNTFQPCPLQRVHRGVHEAGIQSPLIPFSKSVSLGRGSSIQPVVLGVFSDQCRYQGLNSRPPTCKAYSLPVSFNPTGPTTEYNSSVSFAYGRREAKILFS